MIDLICANPKCGKPFQRKAAAVNLKKRAGQHKFYCKASCSSATRVPIFLKRPRSDYY